MDSINQASSGSKKWLYIVIGILVLIVGGFLINGGVTRKVNVGGYNGEVTENFDGSTTYKNDYGTATNSTNKLPDNWPSDVPVYNGTISQSGSSDMMGVNGFQVTMTTSDDALKVLDFYKKGLIASGWESAVRGQALSGTQVGVNTSMTAKKGNQIFMLLITTNKETGKQVITVITGTRPDTSNYKTGL